MVARSFIKTTLTLKQFQLFSLVTVDVDFSASFNRTQNFLLTLRDRFSFVMSQPKTFQHTFSYTAPSAKSVLVTGTFDNWSKTEVLEHVADGLFTATVQIPYHTPGESILYKYVVDEEWLVDSKTETVKDESGIVNNILHAPTQAQAAKPTATESNVADAAPEEPKEEQLPPLFVPPVVLPSDRATYEGTVLIIMLFWVSEKSE